MLSMTNMAALTAPNSIFEPDAEPDGSSFSRAAAAVLKPVRLGHSGFKLEKSDGSYESHFKTLRLPV